MKTEQQRQAQGLYLQTELSKTDIAKIVGVSPRTLHYWVQQNHWDTIKQNARIMPTALAGNCYLILAKLQENILSPERADKPATTQEINAMHRLIVSIGKLADRATLNENLEMMTRFMEFANTQDPRLIDILRPVVDAYIMHQAGEVSILATAAHAITPMPKQNVAEERSHQEDHTSYSGNGATVSTPVMPLEYVAQPLPATAAVIAQAIPHASAQPAQNAKVARPGHVQKGKANNRAARRAQSLAAARQAHTA